MKILVTGANGFIAKNLLVHLQENANYQILTFTRGEPQSALMNKVAQSDFIVHLAGINRPFNDIEFFEGNVDLTASLCDAVKLSGRKIPIIYSSSTQVETNNSYGKSKSQAEELLNNLALALQSPVYIYRLPNVFGKWCRPNYNSVVATFCHNIIHGIPVQINNADAVVTVAYVDDVMHDFLNVIDTQPPGGYRTLTTGYQIAVGELAQQLRLFRQSRESLQIAAVGTGLVRALYSTYISYLPPDKFAYNLVQHGDPRGTFVEVLKTQQSGQFSYFTAHPGVTRGGHYHHTKTEKFIVIQGEARFGFRHIATGEIAEICASAKNPQVVETIPGWAHDITNIGNDEMIVLLWANEIFDPEHPDTVRHQV
jgi:UDP-2-acetamido-2,6-beta-L-arabino-hexul-4-ose reductase